MKFYKSLITGAILVLLSVNTPAIADTASFLASTQKVQDLKAKGSVDEAYALAIQTMGQIRSEIGVDQVVKTIHDNITEEEDQVVAGHHDSSESANGSFSVLFGLLSGGANYDHSLDYDVTKLIMRDPRKGAEFSAKVSADQAALRQSLLSYISDHATDLAVLKVLAVNAFQLVIQRSDQGESTPGGEIEQILRSAEDLNFIGEQKLTVCTKISYAATSRTESAAAGASLNFLLFSAGANGSMKSDDENFAYQETSCNSTVNDEQASDKDLVYNINISRLDQVVLDWANLAIMKSALSGTGEQPFPTWGSPYYKN